MEILNDFNTSVEKALGEIDKNWKKYSGLIICGTHTPAYPESQLRAIEIVRKSGEPFLGICFGHQLAAIEWARSNGIPDATSEEWGQGTFVVKKRKELKVGLHDGESYWNNYEVDEKIEKNWNKPANFFTAQYHPEYQSSIEKPHKLLVAFINYCKEYERKKDTMAM